MSDERLEIAVAVQQRQPVAGALVDQRGPVGNAGEQVPAPSKGLLATVACGPHGNPWYALEGSVFIAGAAIQWLRDGLGVIERADESETLARSIPDNGGVHFVPAFVGLGTPYWEPAARGTITGLTRGTSRAHLVRAALEAMAYSSAELLHTMCSAEGLTVPVLRVDGGAAANDWLMQFQADILDTPRVALDPSRIAAQVVSGIGFLGAGTIIFQREIVRGLTTHGKSCFEFRLDLSDEDLQPVIDCAMK